MGTHTATVFDIDDTLYLERSYIDSGFAAVERTMKSLGADVAGLADLAGRLHDRGVRGRVLDAAFEQLGLAGDPLLVGRAVQIYRSHDPSIALLADARAALERAAAAGAVAIVSDGPLASQCAKVKRLQLVHWSSCIICTSALGPAYHKPSPLAFLRVQRTLRADPEECCYVADNPHKDFSGPKKLGWRTIRVRRPGSLHEHCASGHDVDQEVVDLNT